MQTVFLAAGMVCALVVAIAATRAKHPIRTALASGVLGTACLGAVNLTAVYTGVSIALSYGTALCAVVLGAPGVILMLCLRLLAVR